MTIESIIEGSPLERGVGGVVTDLGITLPFAELSTHHRASLRSPALVEAAETILAAANGIWQPKIVYRWLNVSTVEDSNLTLFCAEDGEEITLDLGCATGFLENARKALVGVYTIGHELQQAGAEASENGQLLESYLYDIIALELLGKIALQVNRIAEEQAERQGWGAGPVLSPGSVHGWDLKDQQELCSVLPIGDIDVEVNCDSVLLPFKSVSFLIGIGPAYGSSKVGSSCKVCSKRADCSMRQDY